MIDRLNSLRIKFGWHLDGSSYPEEPSIGALTVGPLGLVNQLALRLGLSGLAPLPASLRIAEYLSAMESLDNGNRFYSASFATDKWGTAKALLSLRDQLMSAGFHRLERTVDAKVPEMASGRLKLLAELEQSFRPDRLSSSDMILPVVEALEAGRRSAIAEVQVVDSLACLPPIWKRVLAAMEKGGTRVVKLDYPDRVDDTDVGILTRNVLSTHSPSSLSADGTVRFLEADDEIQASDYVSCLIDSFLKRSIDPVFVRGDSTTMLDHFLNRLGQPRLGASRAVPLRSFSQIVPFAFDLSWYPVDPLRIIEFLMLPHCPVPPYIADCFIKALRNSPGVGGGAWMDAWVEAGRRLRSVKEREVADGEDVGNSEEEIELKLNGWREWLEPRCFDPVTGMDSEFITAVCKRLRNHALARFGIFGEETFARVAAEVETLILCVETSRLASITRPQLERMIDSVLSEAEGGRSNPEAASWSFVDHPGQITGPADHVIWWGFIDSENYVQLNNWTKEELSYLDENGVSIERSVDAIVREALAWRRPLLAGCKSISFVVPRTIAGQAAEAHPFFHELLPSISATKPQIRQRIFHQTYKMFGDAEPEFLREEVLLRQLPPLRPTWQITPDRVSRRFQSPSSLEQLLGCPLSWLLRYQAQVRPGDLLSVPDGRQLAGNLAHAVFADLLSDYEVLSNKPVEEIESAAQQCFDQMASKIAAPLMLPGNSYERQRLRSAISQAFVHLCGLVTKAGFSKVACEVEQELDIDDLELRGRADVILMHPDNHDFVIDLKWTQRADHHRRRIVDGHAVQLAFYKHLAGQSSGLATAAGYYMISQQQLFTTARHTFPDAAFVTGPTLEDTFEKVLTSYNEHMKLLSAGTVYATGVCQDMDSYFEGEREAIALEDEEQTIASTVPGVPLMLEPPCKFCQLGRLCGKRGFAGG